MATSNVVNDQIVRPNTPGMPDPNQEIDNPLGTNVTDKKDGSQYTLGYSYNSTLFSFSAQRASRTVGYQDLTSYTSNTRLSRQSDQATFSASP